MSSEVFRSFQRVKSLAFVLVQDVIHAFGLIADEVYKSTKSFAPILDYFEENHIGKRQAVNSSRPRFPIQIWNCYERTLNGDSRTNNFVEAWHGSFDGTIQSHPTVNELLQQILVEQKNVESIWRQLAAGVPVVRSKKELQREDRILKAVQRYNRAMLPEYLDGISIASKSL